jgi:hypothetical protein
MYLYLALILIFSLVSLSSSSAITHSHYTSFMISQTLTKDDPNCKISTQETIAECGASCSINSCNVFKFDKTSKKCVAAKVEKIKLDEQGVMAYVDDSDERKPQILKSKCPETHPFAYQEGARCCQTRLAGVGEELWADHGIFLS